MVLSSTSVVRPSCGAQLKASLALPPSNIWRHCGRRSTLPAHSVLWVSTRLPSPPCVARTHQMRSSPGSTSSVAMCMATTTGATTVRRGRVVKAGSVSVQCVERKGRMCRCGLAARLAFMLTLHRQLTPLTPAAMFVQRRRRPSGVRSPCLTAHTPSMLPARSARSS